VHGRTTTGRRLLQASGNLDAAAGKGLALSKLMLGRVQYQSDSARGVLQHEKSGGADAQLYDVVQMQFV
jgi:hypothetical protein